MEDFERRNKNSNSVPGVPGRTVLVRVKMSFRQTLNKFPSGRGTSNEKSVMPIECLGSLRNFGG